MINVKLFGLLRLDSGIREIKLEASSVKEVYAALESTSDTLSAEKLDACVLLVNGKKAKKNVRLKDGDELSFLAPVAGG